MGGASRDRWTARSLTGPLAVVGVVVLAVAVGAVAATWSAARAGQRSATAVVLLQPAEGNAFTPEGQGDALVNLETEAQLVTSDAVGRAVMHTLGLSGDPQTVLGGVSVVVPTNTQLLQISVRATDAQSAAARATAFAKAYLDYRRGRTESAVAERSTRLQELIRQRERDRSTEVARLAGLAPGSVAATLVSQQVQETTTHIGTLEEQLTTVQATSLDPGQVVTPGTVDPPSLLARPTVVGPAAALLVVVAMLVLLAGVRRARNAATLVSIEDLIGITPESAVVLGELAAPARPDHAPVLLARSLLVDRELEGPVTVVVGPLSAGPSSGLGHALAQSLARAHYEVVEVDLHDPRTVDALCELVLGDSSVGHALHPQQPFLSGLVPAGEPRPDVRAELGDLIASAALPRVLDELGKRADVVLIDPGPLLGRVGRALLPRVQDVVAETCAGVTTAEDVREVVGATRSAGVRLVGLVHARPVDGRPRVPAHAGDPARTAGHE